ncbi:MAG: CBS domain-containing protein [Pseudomonadota bacterium]|nr:CBS domain-containing protein [Pseudomonadota bacterium]
MRVGEVMTTDVEFVDSGMTVQEAAVTMGELDVGALPVGNAARVEGIVTDRDVLYRVVAKGRDPARITVGEILSRPVVTCAEDDSVASVMDLMAANHIRRMPVLDPAGQVSGWITLADLARKLLVESEALQGALQGLTEPG